MNELALFAGAGGGILGGHLLGWKTVCAVEQEPYAISVLLQRQNDKIFPPFPVWDDICTFDGRPWKGVVDVVSGGFPCQDISTAGKGAGIKGSRSGLWSEMARVIGEVKPEWVFAENSPMLVSRGLNIVLSDLAQMGFNARWGVVGADDIGANHKRKRIWIVARNVANSSRWILRSEKKSKRSSPHVTRCGSRTHERGKDKTTKVKQANVPHSNCNCKSDGSKHEKKQLLGNSDNNGQFAPEIKRSIIERSNHRKAGEIKTSEFKRSSEQYENVADTDSERGCLRQTIGQDAENARQSSRGTKSRNWDIEPDVGRVVNGMAARTHRLKAIGNGQVPEVARRAWEILSKDL